MLLLGCLLSLGVWSGNQRAKRLDLEMREVLLRKVEELSLLVNPNLARELSFTIEDQGTPAYEIIRDQLTRIGKTFPQRGIYTMALKGKRIVFGPENYPPQDPMASVPGSVYEEPSENNFQVFTEKRPITLGPVKDEFGAFVSALAPVFDVESGEVLMVVGIDILASDWQSRLDNVRRGPILLTLILAFLILFGVYAGFWRHQRIRSDAMRLKRWILIPIVFLMLGGGLIYGAYEYREFNEESQKNMLHLVQRLRREWNQGTASRIQLLRAQLDRIADNPALMKAWKDRDLVALNELAEPVFEQLKQEYGITHYYFIEPDHTCFFRAHKPDLRGDRIDRYTLQAAEQSGQDAWGIEVGPLSALTLRCVRPMKTDGKILGYLELGMESERFTRKLGREEDLEILLVLNKKYTSQERFEAGRKVFNFSGTWGAYPGFVIVSQTFQSIPMALDRWLLKSKEERDLEIFRVDEGPKAYLCGAIPLFDAMGRDVARLLVINDATDENKVEKSALLINMWLFLAILTGVLMLLWAVIDSAEKQLQQAFRQLRETSESFRHQFSDNSAVMLLIDPRDGRLIDVNAAAIRFYGYSRDRLMEMSIMDLNTLAASEVRRALMSATSEQGRQFEFQHRLENGSVRDVSVSTSLIKSGDRLLLHSIIHDITDRKRTERELRDNQLATMNLLEDLTATNKRLEDFTKALNEARTEAELQTWGLQKANDGIKALYQEMEKKNVELARLDQLKNDFVSIVAHELRNPLMVIREAAILILDGLAGPVEKEQKGYLTMVHKTSDQLIHITNDLLDLAKIEAGKIVLNCEKIDLCSLVRQSCEGINLRAQKKAIVVSVDCPSRTVEIEADFDKLAQVMINLLSNALKFTEKGSITVEIKDLGEEVRCAVKDTGAGISEGNLLKLFNKFMQFTKKDALEEKGTGLGLVICQSIIKAHGGRMEVESELGKGSTFSFFLPKQQKINKEF